MNTYYISLIILFLVGFLYLFKKPKSFEGFENLPKETRTSLGQKIREKDDLESTIELINKQIEERENLNSVAPDVSNVVNKEVKEETQVQDNSVFSTKNTNLVNVDLKDYVHKSNVPDINNYIHKDKMPDMTQYMKRTQMPDMNRYILKTEIPSYPDMTKYILKNQVPKCPKMPNMHQYILKTEIPPPKLCPDMSKFVLKSSVPPIQKPVCPKPNCLKCDEKTAKKNTNKKTLPKKNIANADAVPQEGAIISEESSKSIHNLIPRNMPVKEIPKKSPPKINHPVTKPKEIKDSINTYKPKLGKRKCNIFHKIIKNANIYGAY